MSWDEFCTYLSSINEKTSLGKIVAIRSEKDPKIIKNMTPEQKRIKREWEKKSVSNCINNYTKEEYEKMMLEMSSELKKAFS